MCLVLVMAALVTAKTKKIKLKPNSNPPQYIAFSKPLPEADQYLHALDRLTFGPRLGDVEQIRKIGIEAWTDGQLHPDQLPESPELEGRLQPYESVRMSIHDTWVHYPPPQMIAAVARGRLPLPEDPQLRSLVVHLADRYLRRRELKAASASSGANALGDSRDPMQTGKALAPEKTEVQSSPVATDPNDLSDLDHKVNVADILTPPQIRTLRNGKPEEKKQLLASLPPETWTDLAWSLPPRERQQLYGIAPVDLRRTLMLSVSPSAVVASDLSEARLLRAIYSTHQLEELMVDFWYNHFNVYIDKAADRFLVPTYEREAIRPRVFGNFYDLLLATAKSPAMLFFLDNAESVGANSPASLRPNVKNKRGLNENYGRELMELHTLGVDGGYTQKDVIEVARCFTGWTLAPPRRGGGFEFNDRMHDGGQKVVLGHIIPAGGGMEDGLKVLQILAHHPATAHFISLKLARRFVADDPPPSLVNRMTETFSKTDGNIREVIRTMITSPEFWSEGAYRAKVKMPFELVVSAVRATNATVDSPFPLIAELQRLGEPLYRKIEPTGYKSVNAEWVSSSSLLERMNFGLALCSNKVAGLTVDEARWRKLEEQGPITVARALLDQDPSEQTRSAIEKTLTDQSLQQQLAANAKTGKPQVPSLIAGLVIGSPEFQRR